MFVDWNWNILIPVVFVICIVFQTAIFLSNIRDRIKTISGKRDIYVWQPLQTEQPACCQTARVTGYFMAIIGS